MSDLKSFLSGKTNDELFEFLQRYTDSKRTLIGHAIHDAYKKKEDPFKVFQMIYDQYRDNPQTMIGVVPMGILDAIVERIELL